METWPDCAPAIRASSTPVTSRSAATACSTRLAGPKSCPFRPRNVPSCHVCPKRAGLAAASDTPAENVKAASTPSTPVTAPTRAGRTGTAERPRPGSSAKRAPTTTGTGSPAPDAVATTADRRWAPCRRLAVSAVAVATADPASTRTGAATQPALRTSQSTSIPGCGSTMDATPIGIHREATIAPTTPAVVPAAAARKGAAEADCLAPCHAYCLQDLEIHNGCGGVTREGLADQEEGGHQGRQREGQQAGGLVPGDPADGVTEVDDVVPHVDVGPPGDAGQVGTERGNRGGASLEPHQRVDVCPRAHDVGAVMGEQSRRREHASLLPWTVRGSGPPGRTAHPDDAGPDAGSARWSSRSVVARAGLAWAWQVQGERVANVLAVARDELGGYQDLIGSAGVEQPSLQHDGPLDCPGEFAVRGREPGARIGAAVQRESEADRERAQRADLRQCTDLGPVEARLVRQDGGGRGQRACPQPAERGLPAPRSGHCRENRRCDQGDQQSQNDQRTPASAPLQAQPGKDNPHGHSTTRPLGSADAA